MIGVISGHSFELGGLKFGIGVQIIKLGVQVGISSLGGQGAGWDPGDWGQFQPPFRLKFLISNYSLWTKQFPEPQVFVDFLLLFY